VPVPSDGVIETISLRLGDAPAGGTVAIEVLIFARAPGLSSTPSQQRMSEN
jgi:hypothetical protein